ncbi:MAG TPA: lipid A deacylase LpxR family protein [Steroidobacteraceae bacterium]
MSRLLLPALALCCAWMPAAARAECAARTHTHVPKGQWYLHWENDLFTRFASDEYFTNGVRVGYAWDPGCERGWVRAPARWLEDSWLGRRLGIDDTDEYTRSSTFAIGQSIYTPSDITIEAYLPNDHPYGAWLYGLLRHDYTSALHDEAASWGSQVQKSVELQLGVVGPAAGGAEVQKWVHEVMDDKDPKGWEHQLANEPGLMASFLWQKRYARKSRTFDVIPSLGVALGNVQTYALAGLTMRVGQNIAGFPSRPVEAARVAAGELRDDHSTCFGIHFFSECYLFLGGEARYVAQNVFLDGNTWRDGGPHVHREPLVVDVVAGLRLRIPQWGLTFTYTGVRRSREFEPVPVTSRHRDGRHEYGVASFSWDTHF